MRISRGSFAADRDERVDRVMRDGRDALIAALRPLPGLRAYWASVDPVSNTAMNVSLWDSLAQAGRMDRLPAMDRYLRRPALAAGVDFDLLANYPVAWSVGQPAGSARCVRVSTAAFPKSGAARIARVVALQESDLRAPLERMRGFGGYAVGTDAKTGTASHFSFWDSVADAQQLDGLPEMQRRAADFAALGADFQPPINFPVAWSI